MYKKSLVIGIVLGIGIGVVLMAILGILMIEMFPYTSIEDVCFEQTYSAVEYEKCIKDLRDNG